MTDEMNNGAQGGRLTLVRGGKLSPAEFAALTLPEKLEHLRGVGAKRRLDLIMSDPEAARIVRAFPAPEVFWLIKELGASEALELVHLSSPEQLTFYLDMELWEKWNLSEKKAMEWLGYLVEGGEDLLRGLLPVLDPELLVLVLAKEITVGGGIGELATDDERLAPWDHTFDNVYFITFVHKKRARLIGTFLDMVYRVDHGLYLALMEGVRNETASELEELAWKFRSGRLADEGFPELEDALSIYARIDPATFVPGSGKTSPSTPPPAGLSLLPVTGDSFLQRVLRRAPEGQLEGELNYLVNSALVAEGAVFPEASDMEAIIQRVHGSLTIALEFLCGTDEAGATEIVKGEYLKRLFQLGWSIVLGLTTKAAALESAEYATGRVLAGLTARHPRFHRALDPDRVDGYREFRDLDDVRKVEAFLAALEHQRGE